MAAKTSSPNATPTLLPPDESMWQKYSPHYELPLASATSIFLHGLIIGGLAVGGIAYLFSFNQEASKPPSMNVVMLEGGDGGFAGGGGTPGLPGDPNAVKTEFTPATNQTPMERTEASPPSLLPPESPPELTIPSIDEGNPPVNADVAAELAEVAKAADKAVRAAMELPPVAATPNPKKSGGAVGPKGPKGQAGQGGNGGNGPGKGQGANTGAGGPAGRLATKQEVFAWRWRFDLSGDGKEHARKLAAMGVTLAIPDPRGNGFYLITDLNRRPVELKKDSLVAFKDAVKWRNDRPESLQALTRELQLKFVPKYVMLLLPQEREQKMAEEEKQFADSQRRDVSTVRATWFDFRLKNGTYDPSVIRQE